MKDNFLRLLFILLTVIGFQACSDNMEIPENGTRPNASSRALTSPENNYYYFRGEKIPVQVSDSLCYVIYEIQDNQAKDCTSNTPIAYGKIEAKEILISQKHIANNINSKIVAIENVINDSIPVLNECYVKLRNDEELQILIKIAQEHNCEVTPPNEYSAQWAIVHTSLVSDMTSLEMSNYLYETGLFEDTDPGIALMANENYIPSDPYYSTNQWNLKSSNGGINMTKAWDYTTGTNTIRVAIFDLNGVRENLSDLSGQFLGLSYDCQQGSSPSRIRNIAFPEHATEVASIIAAKHNGTGIAGIAPGCKFISYSISGASPYQFARGLNHAYQNAVSVFNFSFSSLPSSIISSAIDNLTQNGRNGKGAVVCIAAGNNGVVEYPANAHPDAIVVGATNANGVVCSFSGQGTELDIVAPGEDISVLSGATGSVLQKSGTSYACPHVAGVAALMLSANPSLTALEVEDILKHTASAISSYSIYPNSSVGWGLLNAAKALKIVTGDFDIQTEYSSNTAIGYPTTQYMLSDVPYHCTVSWQSLTGVLHRNLDNGPEYTYNFNGQQTSETIQATLSAGSYSLTLNKTLDIYNIPKIRRIERISTELEENSGRVDLKAVVASPNASITWSIDNNPNVSLIDFPNAGDAGYSDPYERYQSIVFRSNGYYSIPITVTTTNTYGYDTETYLLEYYCSSPSIMRLGNND